MQEQDIENDVIETVEELTDENTIERLQQMCNYLENLNNNESIFNQQEYKHSSISKNNDLDNDLEYHIDKKEYLMEYSKLQNDQNVLLESIVEKDDQIKDQENRFSELEELFENLNYQLDNEKNHKSSLQQANESLITDVDSLTFKLKWTEKQFNQLNSDFLELNKQQQLALEIKNKKEEIDSQIQSYKNESQQILSTSNQKNHSNKFNFDSLFKNYQQINENKIKQILSQSQIYEKINEIDNQKYNKTRINKNNQEYHFSQIFQESKKLEKIEDNLIDVERDIKSIQYKNLLLQKTSIIIELNSQIENQENQINRLVELNEELLTQKDKFQDEKIRNQEQFNQIKSLEVSLMLIQDDHIQQKNKLKDLRYFMVEQRKFRSIQIDMEQEIFQSCINQINSNLQVIQKQDICKSESKIVLEIENMKASDFFGVIKLYNTALIMYICRSKDKIKIENEYNQLLEVHEHLLSKQNELEKEMNFLNLDEGIEIDENDISSSVDHKVSDLQTIIHSIHSHVE